MDFRMGLELRSAPEDAPIILAVLQDPFRSARTSGSIICHLVFYVFRGLYGITGQLNDAKPSLPRLQS
jgi:hypothetical protein